MSHIDLTARLAGLNETPPDEVLTPHLLIERFCARGIRSGFGQAKRRAHSDWHTGFIAWTGDEHGYDGGYTYMEALIASGWVPQPALGDWPYVIYLTWPARASDPRHAIAHYCEGDFGVEIFDDKQGALAALRALRDERQEEHR